MRDIDVRVQRLVRFGFTNQQARALAEAGFDVFFIRAEAIGL